MLISCCENIEPDFAVCTGNKKPQASLSRSLAEFGDAAHVLLDLAGYAWRHQQTSLNSGHSSVDTMWKHYHRGTKKPEAEKFWSIVPPRADAKIIAFASA
jgi:hypothetical protein